MIRNTWIFFVLTFVISWLLWLPSVLRSTGYADLPEIVGLAGMFAVLGPTIAGFIMIGKESGRAGMVKMLQRAFTTGFNKRWWLPTLLLMPVIGLLTAALMTFLRVKTPTWTAPTLVTALVTALTILFIGGGLEEFGWRGYALDRMQNGRNALTASLVLGFFWGLWHLPLFFIKGTTQAEAAIPVWEFVLQIMVLSVLFTWLYNNTGGSLLVSILFHTIGNTTAAVLPPYFATSIGRWVYFGLLLIAAISVVLVWGWRTLNKDQVVPRPSIKED